MINDFSNYNATTYSTKSDSGVADYRADTSPNPLVEASSPQKEAGGLNIWIKIKDTNETMRKNKVENVEVEVKFIEDTFPKRPKHMKMSVQPLKNKISDGDTDKEADKDRKKSPTKLPEVTKKIKDKIILAEPGKIAKQRKKGDENYEKGKENLSEEQSKETEEDYEEIQDDIKEEDSKETDEDYEDIQELTATALVQTTDIKKNPKQIDGKVEKPKHREFFGVIVQN